MRMTIERKGWYSGHTIQVVEVENLQAAGRWHGYDSSIFVKRQYDGAWYADLSDYRYGDSAYICKVTVEKIAEVA